MNWQTVYKSNYRLSLLSQQAWVSRAIDLFLAADALVVHVHETWEKWETYNKTQQGPIPTDGFIAIYFMLSAFGIENLLKAALIRDRYAEIDGAFRTNARLPKVLKSHKLFKLCQQLGLVLTKQEEDLLRRLERSAVWYGRYPVPLTINELQPKKFTDGRMHTLANFKKADTEHLLVLREKIRNELSF